MFVLLCVALLSTKKLFSLARLRGVFFLSKYCTASNNILTAHVEEANEIFILSCSQNREMFIFLLRHAARVQAAKRLSIHVVGNWRSSTARQVAYLKFTGSFTS
jgi:hypothetical protein